MRKLMKLFCYAFFMFWTVPLISIYASAYIDPSTTAMITQIVAGAVISLGIAFGIFRQRIMAYFKGLKVKRMQRKISKEQGE